MTKIWTFVKLNWWRVPLIPVRVSLLLTAWYVFQPLAKYTELLGSMVPGLVKK